MSFKPLKFNFNSARARLFLLVLLVVVPALAVQIYGAWSDLQQSLGERKLESVRVIERAQSDFNSLLNETRSVFSDLVRVNDMRSTNNCTQVFTALRFSYERLAPEATNLGLANANGEIYCAVNPVQGDKNMAGQLDFQNATQTLDMALGVYTPNPQNGAPFVSVSYPVLSFDGRVQTVIFAIFQTRWLEKWQNENILPPGAAITLFAPDGQGLWRTVSGKNVLVTGLTSYGVKWFPDLRAGETVVESPDFDGVTRLHTLIPLKLDGQVSAYLHLGYPVTELYDKAVQNLWWKLGLLGLVVLVAFALAWWGSDRLFLHPLKDLLGVVERVQAGDLGARVSTVTGLGELTALAQSFDRMTDSLQQREAERQESDARFRAMFATSAVGIGIMSLERKIIDANPAMCKMFGYSLDEIVGQVPAMATYPEDYTRATQLFEDMMAGKRSSYFDERRFVRKNGEMFWGRITMSIVRDANGKPLYMVGMVLDVDEERLALAKLQESEARFKAIYENAPIGISLIGPNQKILAVNPALVRLSGRSEAELIKLGSQRITYPEDVNVGREEFVDVMQGKRESFQVEKRYVHKDGRVQWMRQSISAVRDATGSLVYLLSIAEDIDQQKRAVEELRESEARFRAMFENSAIGVLVLDVESLSVRANAAAGIILDNRHLERVLIDIHDFIHPDYQLAERPQLDELLNGKRDSFETEQWYCKSNGVCNCAHVTYSSVRASDGRLRYVVGMLQDITERKNAQDTLRESEARFRSMFDNAAVGVAVMTLDRHITQINQTASRLTGYSADEISKIDPSMLAVEEDRSIDQELFVELIEGKRDQYTVEKRYIRKDGEIFWGRVNFSAVRGADGKPLYTIGMIEDISKEKRAAEKLAAQDAKHRRMLEQRIAERTDELNRANELLREKAAQDAVTAERTRLARDLHDAVTQTLFSTTLIADVLPEIWEMNANEGKRRLEEVRQLTRGALAEMRTLLVELRPNALVEVPLPTLLRQLTEALIGRSRMNIQLSAEGERKLPADVQVGLYRVAQEALNNVVKHAHATQAVVTLRMGEVTRLTVQDNGAGFDPGTVTADHLGLKIMRERAEAIGAKYSIYSEPGEGTQISIVWEEKPSATKNTTPAPPGGARE